ncbi:MAG: toll/interleukin-1 receptor domain-containing protein, partial [Allosphingosinicella sp.]
MADIFVSYKNDDRTRVARLVAALRAAGFDTWWDQDIPPGGGWRETIVRELDAATLCLVAWSEASTGENGRFVREEAERAASRGAYLGVLIDPVLPPFGFGEWQALDLSGWRGKASDPRLDRIVAQVRARLAGGPVPDQGPALPPPRARRRKPPVLMLAAVLVLLAAAGGLAWRFWPAAPGPSPTAFVNQRLTGTECAWLQIANVAPSADGGERLALAGIAAAPEALQTSIMRSAIEQRVALAELDVADVAVSPPETCAELELLRRFRWPGRSRLTIVPPRGELQRTEYGWSGRFEFETDFADLPARAALLG